MKFRTGFVSNSSSSSFVCEVCGDTFESWDEGISHFGLVLCYQEDHLFCEDHRINPNSDGSYTTYEEEGEDTRIDSKHCPICQMKTITDHMVLMYLLKKYDLKYTEVQDEMRESFETFENFHDYLEGYEPEWGIELTVHTRVKALNSMEACKKAREEVIKDPIIMLDVTHCERM